MGEEFKKGTGVKPNRVVAGLGVLIAIIAITVFGYYIVKNNIFASPNIKPTGKAVPATTGATHISGTSESAKISCPAGKTGVRISVTNWDGDGATPNLKGENNDKTYHAKVGGGKHSCDKIDLCIDSAKIQPSGDDRELVWKNKALLQGVAKEIVDATKTAPGANNQYLGTYDGIIAIGNKDKNFYRFAVISPSTSYSCQGPDQGSDSQTYGVTWVIPNAYKPVAPIAQVSQDKVCVNTGDNKEVTYIKDGTGWTPQDKADTTSPKPLYDQGQSGVLYGSMKTPYSYTPGACKTAATDGNKPAGTAASLEDSKLKVPVASGGAGVTTVASTNWPEGTGSVEFKAVRNTGAPAEEKVPVGSVSYILRAQVSGNVAHAQSSSSTLTQGTFDQIFYDTTVCISSSSWSATYKKTSWTDTVGSNSSEYGHGAFKIIKTSSGSGAPNEIYQGVDKFSRTGLDGKGWSIATGECTGAGINLPGTTTTDSTEDKIAKKYDRPDSPIAQIPQKAYEATKRAFQSGNYSFSSKIIDNGFNSREKIVKLPPGKYSLELSKEDFKSTVYEFELADGQTFNQELDITPKENAEPPAVRITSNKNAPVINQSVSGAYETMVDGAAYIYAPYMSSSAQKGWQLTTNIETGASATGSAGGKSITPGSGTLGFKTVRKSNGATVAVAGVTYKLTQKNSDKKIDQNDPDIVKKAQEQAKLQSVETIGNKIRYTFVYEVEAAALGLLGKSATSTGKTPDTGIYSAGLIKNLPTGVYDLEISKDGFGKVVVENFALTEKEVKNLPEIELTPNNNAEPPAYGAFSAIETSLKSLHKLVAAAASLYYNDSDPANGWTTTAPTTKE